MRGCPDSGLGVPLPRLARWGLRRHSARRRGWPARPCAGVRRAQASPSPGVPVKDTQAEETRAKRAGDESPAQPEGGSHTDARGEGTGWGPRCALSPEALCWSGGGAGRGGAGRTHSRLPKCGFAHPHPQLPPQRGPAQVLSGSRLGQGTPPHGVPPQPLVLLARVPGSPVALAPEAGPGRCPPFLKGPTRRGATRSN